MTKKMSGVFLVAVGLCACGGGSTPTQPAPVAMADRTKTMYGKAIVPDEVIAEPVEVVHRAVALLRLPGGRVSSTPSGGGPYVVVRQVS